MDSFCEKNRDSHKKKKIVRARPDHHLHYHAVMAGHQKSVNANGSKFSSSTKINACICLLVSVYLTFDRLD